MVWWEVVELLQPCNPDITSQVLRQTLDGKPEEVSLELVCELVAQLVTDLKGWSGGC